jgi:hypothetical protein
MVPLWLKPFASSMIILLPEFTLSVPSFLMAARSSKSLPSMAETSLTLRQFRNRVVSHELSVSHNGNSVADRIDLLQEVRDKQNADALFLQDRASV